LEDFSFFLNNKIGGDFITFKYRYRKQIILVIISIIIISSITYYIYQNTKNSSSKEETIIAKADLKKEKPKQEEIKEVKVDIKGAILTPGIYSLDSNSRVVDVIEKAGGLTENADTSVINLSKKITDEMVIIIYTKEEVKNFKETKEKENTVQNKCQQKDENALKNDACIKDKQSSNSSQKISLNTATKEELMNIPGIGETKAKDIISYREKNGPFKTLDELTKVNGIGENILAQIKENLTL